MIDAPPTISNDGHLWYSEIELPVAAKLLFMWVYLGPVILFFGARRGQLLKAAVTYLSGLLLVVIAGNLITFGWPTAEKIRQGLASLWLWEAYGAVIVGGVFSAVAVAAGYASRLIWKPAPGRDRGVARR